jgi:hypothetical protein
LQLLLQFIPCFAPLLFRDPTFFPIDLCPSTFTAMVVPKAIHTLYQAALQSAIAAAPDTVPHIIIHDIFERLNDQSRKLRPPLQSPFATVCQWAADVQSDSPLSTVITLLLDLLKPASVAAVRYSFADLPQPLHREVLLLVSAVLEKHFPGLRPQYAAFPPLVPAIASPSGTFLVDCWRMDWPAIAESLHLLVFARMLLPRALTSTLASLTDTEFFESVLVAVQKFAPLSTSFQSLISGCSHGAD